MLIALAMSLIERSLITATLARDNTQWEIRLELEGAPP